MDLHDKGTEDSFEILDCPLSLMSNEVAIEAEEGNSEMLKSDNQLTELTNNLLHNVAILKESQIAIGGILTASVISSSSSSNDKNVASTFENPQNNTTSLNNSQTVAAADIKSNELDKSNAAQDNKTAVTISQANIFPNPMTESVNSSERNSKVDQQNQILNSSMYSSGSGSEKPSSSNDKVNDLAASYIMGEINADVLKSNIFSQYPSLNSFSACPEDAWKLQKIMSDYMNLQDTIKKLTQLLTDIYNQVREKKELHKQEIENFQKQIETQRNENIELKCEIETKIQAMKLRDEQFIKQQNDIQRNVSDMQIQIVKQQDQDENFKEQLSAVIAENFDLKDVQKQYIDEINCLKVNLTAAEELIKQAHTDIDLMKAKDIERSDEIALIRQQVEIYRKDFETERFERQNLASEKDQLLQDLRIIQNKNQQLLQDYQRLIAEQPEPIQNVTPEAEIPPAKNKNDKSKSPSPTISFTCPVCMNDYPSLTILQEHVNNCLDQA